MSGTGRVEPQGPLIFLVAGEPSGDRLGARLMAALKRETKGRVRFAGVGGPGMESEGLDSLVPIQDLAVMGLVEVLPHIPRIYRAIRRVAKTARQMRPQVVVTIDSPNFTLEVGKRLAGQGFPLIHYVAPSVWAWKAGRARRMARYLDHVLTLLPFEPPYFERHGLPATFVGHPAVENPPLAADAKAFRERHGIAVEAPLICVLPGSRRGEVKRLSPIFGQALGLLKDSIAGLQAIVPTVSTVENLVARMTRDWPVPVVVCRGESERRGAFAASRAALAASGTVAVELAAAGLPAVIAYKVAPFTAFMARRFLDIRYVALPSILLGREVQPEYLQERCTAANLAAETERLIVDPAVRDAQIAEARAAVSLLDPGEDPPSRRAARVVLQHIAHPRSRAGLPGPGDPLG